MSFKEYLSESSDIAELNESSVEITEGSVLWQVIASFGGFALNVINFLNWLATILLGVTGFSALNNGEFADPAFATGFTAITIAVAVSYFTTWVVKLWLKTKVTDEFTRNRKKVWRESSDNGAESNFNSLNEASKMDIVKKAIQYSMAAIKGSQAFKKKDNDKFIKELRKSYKSKEISKGTNLSEKDFIKLERDLIKSGSIIKMPHVVMEFLEKV